jgi:hypothetical protein
MWILSEKLPLGNQQRRRHLLRKHHQLPRLPLAEAKQVARCCVLLVLRSEESRGLWKEAYNLLPLDLDPVD